MVPITDRLNYRAKMAETPKIRAFLNFIEGTRRLEETEGQLESDSFFYGCLHAFIKEDNAAFLNLYNDYSRREPDERSPYVRDEYLLFVLLCCVNKFSADKTWLNKVFECRHCSTDECTQTNETFKALLRGDIQNTSNLTALALLFQEILHKPLLNNEHIKNMYSEYMKSTFPFYKSDFLNLTAFKAIDIVIAEADIAGDGKSSTLKNFEISFLKRTGQLAEFMHLIVIILIISTAVHFYIKQKDQKDQIDSLNTIVGLLSLAGLTLPAVFKREFIIGYFQDMIRKYFGYK